MNNLYHKVAVASVCTALDFASGANEEAYSATFTLPPTITFGVRDSNFDGRGDLVPENYTVVGKGARGEEAEFAEFYVGGFPFTPNTVINSAVIYTEIFTFEPIYGGGKPGSLGIFGYVGNGTVETSDFEAGVFLSSVNTSFGSYTLNFDVTPFLNQRVRNADAFAGFGIRALNFGNVQLWTAKTELIVETADVAEPVPEPTTIFGSAIGLCLAGWLKRKKSAPQSKVKLQA